MSGNFSGPAQGCGRNAGSFIAAHQSTPAGRTAPIETVGAANTEPDPCYFSSDAANALGRTLEGRIA